MTSIYSLYRECNAKLFSAGFCYTFLSLNYRALWIMVALHSYLLCYALCKITQHNTFLIIENLSGYKNEPDEAWILCAVEIARIVIKVCLYYICYKGKLNLQSFCMCVFHSFFRNQIKNESLSSIDCLCNLKHVFCNC